MRRKLEELIRTYNAIISALEDDISEQNFGNTYRVGRRSAFVNVVEDLEELLESEEEEEYVDDWDRAAKEDEE